MRKIGPVVLGYLAMAVIATVLLPVIRQNVTIHDIAKRFQFSLIYTFCIAPPAWVVMERIGPRLSGSRYVRIPSIVVVLAFMALTGSLSANIIFVLLGWQGLVDFWREFGYGLRIAVFMIVVIGAAAFFEVLRVKLQKQHL